MPLNYPFNPLARVSLLTTTYNSVLLTAFFVILLIGLIQIMSLVILLILDIRQSRQEEQVEIKLIPIQAFGKGAQNDFSWYFEGQSRVAVSSIDEICAWLRACEYVHDQVLFMKHDFWQHPLTFEQIRKGDCEDHALWAWRKMKELGIPALFVVGEVQTAGYHAWVVFVYQGRHYVLETTTKSGTMVYPLRRAKPYYHAELGIDHTLKVYRYN
ncbi:MAG: transglutaminase domain-containing protein [Anaerolineae bacterium]|nr:transglutaminase domain-containing protein [Anaerolineae bacterium]